MTLILNMAPTLKKYEQDVQITNRNGSYINGEWIEDPNTYITIRAVVQPKVNRFSTNNSYGEEANGNMAFWSKSEIKVANDTLGTPSDIILVDSVRYKIISVRLWNKYNFYMAVGEQLSERRQGG
jgi:hypothetical protein